jgi:hypothetical protein
MTKTSAWEEISVLECLAVEAARPVSIERAKTRWRATKLHRPTVSQKG